MAPNSEAAGKVVVAVDLGGTAIKAGIIGPSGVHDRQRVPSERQRGPDAVIDTVIDQVTKLLTRCDELDLEAVGVGVAVPGVVDDAGVGRLSVTMGWRDLPVHERVAGAVSCPVVVSHDVRAGAVAESSFGAAVGEAIALFLPIGTGISAAIVLDGTIVAGASFRAGELGQTLVSAPLVGAPGGTGALVTLEVTSSARAIAERYARVSGFALDSVSAEDVGAAAVSGDSVAAAVWNEAVDRLGVVLAAAIGTIDPGVVVIGGGLSLAGAALLDPLAEAIVRYLPWREPPRLAMARFADDAGFVGTAITAWRDAAGFDVGALAGVLGNEGWRTSLAVGA